MREERLAEEREAALEQRRRDKEALKLRAVSNKAEEAMRKAEHVLSEALAVLSNIELQIEDCTAPATPSPTSILSKDFKSSKKAAAKPLQPTPDPQAMASPSSASTPHDAPWKRDFSASPTADAPVDPRLQHLQKRRELQLQRVAAARQALELAEKHHKKPELAIAPPVKTEPPRK